MADEPLQTRKVLTEAALVFLPSLLFLSFMALAARTGDGSFVALALISLPAGGLVGIALLNGRTVRSSFGRAFKGFRGGLLVLGLNLFISFWGCLAVDTTIIGK